MKINKKFFIIIFWIIALIFFKSTNFITLDINAIQNFLQANEKYLIPIFIFIWIIRIFVFIPGVTFMVIGGICFGPAEGIILSTVGIFISETMIYFISKYFSLSNYTHLINSKYSYISDLVKKYDYKFLALGIICPLAPTDVICFLASSIGIKYKKYILTVIISNLPLIALYSFIGTSITSSIYIIALGFILIAIVGFITVSKWNSMRTKSEGSDKLYTIVKI